MNSSVHCPASPPRALATSTLIQLAFAVLRIDAHSAATHRVWSRAAARSDTTVIATVAALVSSEAKWRMR